MPVIYNDFESEYARQIYYSGAPFRYKQNVPKLSGRSLAIKLNGKWTDGLHSLSLKYSNGYQEEQKWTYYDEELHKYSVGTWHVVGDSQIELWERPPNFLEIFDTCEWLCEVAQLILAFLDPNPSEPKFKFWVDQKPEDDVAINWRTCFVDGLRLSDRKSFRCRTLDEGLQHRLMFKRIHLKKTNDESACVYE